MSCLLCLVVTLLPLANAEAQRGVTVSQILEERDTTTPDPRPARRCNGNRFKPCICWQDVTKRVMYRPRVRECGGNAAIILTGTYARAFSAVLRDVENADRIPNPLKETVNGCTREIASSEAPPNRCSVFKAQSVIRTSDERGEISVHCMGTPGNSRFGRLARRITVKLQDRPQDNLDPLVRLCLRSPLQNLN